jgi:ribosomal protein S18 acetylase RimI-like enzyme
MKGISIRKAKKEEYDEVINLLLKFSANPKLFGNRQNNSFHKILETKNSSIEVASRGNKIVGFITYSLRHVARYSRPVMQIEELFVDEEFRMQGVGGQLINYVFKIAVENNCQHIDVLADNKDAILFYQSCGFAKKYDHYRYKP